MWTSNQEREKRRKGRNGSVLPPDAIPEDSGVATNGTSSTRASTAMGGSNTSLDSAASGRRRETTISTNPAVNQQAKRRNRESYFEAVSMGSLDERGSIASMGNSSVTTEPIDL